MKFVLQQLARWGGLGLVLAVVTGCATSRVDWNTRVGTYSYDDAIREFGPPDKSAKLTDGSTVADWLTGRGYQTASTFGGGWGPYGRYGFGPSYVIVDPPTPDRYLRLVFDADNKLAAWQKTYR